MPQFIPFAGTVGSWLGAGGAVAGTSAAAATAGAATVGGTAILAGAGAGYVASQAQKEIKSAKSAAGDMEAKNNAMIKDMQEAQAAASTQAMSAISERRKRTSSQTIFTNPLGIADAANTAKKSILGL